MIARSRLSPTKEVTGGRRATTVQKAERPRLYAVAEPTAQTPATWRVRAKRGRTGSGQGFKKPEGLGSQRAASVCRRPGAPQDCGRAERPRVYAVAEPAATPEDRQSERSEVCRDRATEKYRMPEGRACRRVAGVRPAPEAGREPLRGGRARMPGGRRGGAKPGHDGRWQPRGRAGEKDAAGGAPSRQGATPRRDPGDCNAGRLPRRSVKRARSTQRAGKPRTCGRKRKHRARISKGGAGPWGRGKGRRRPCPSAEGKMQGP